MANVKAQTSRTPQIFTSCAVQHVLPLNVLMPQLGQWPQALKYNALTTFSVGRAGLHTQVSNNTLNAMSG